jgi:hypothetical protein
MNKKVEIAIILFSDKGREINFRDLKSGSSYLDIEEYTPYFFWKATGGFEIIADGYKTIFRGFEFYVSLEAIRFLLHSLNWLKGRTNGFDTDADFPDSVVARFQNNRYIKFSKKEKDIVSLSYQSTLQIDEVRGNRLFESEQFLSRDWVEAVTTGLKEYFDILIPVLIDHPGDKQEKILTNYLVNEWYKVKY